MSDSEFQFRIVSNPSESGETSVRYVNGVLQFHHSPVGYLVSSLYQPEGRRGADRPVIDMTGLHGFFDFTLEWAPYAAQPDPTSTAPSLFTALQEQLGLKLQPQKYPVDYLVIDSAERPIER